MRVQSASFHFFCIFFFLPTAHRDDGCLVWADASAAGLGEKREKKKVRHCVWGSLWWREIYLQLRWSRGDHEDVPHIMSTVERGCATVPVPFVVVDVFIRHTANAYTRMNRQAKQHKINKIQIKLKQNWNRSPSCHHFLSDAWSTIQDINLDIWKQGIKASAPALGPRSQH